MTEAFRNPSIQWSIVILKLNRIEELLVNEQRTLGKSTLCSYLKYFAQSLFSLLDIQEDFVELKMVQRRTKRNYQKYSMAWYKGMANADEQLKLEGYS